MMATIQLTARANCKWCGGSGVITDWVPYAGNNTALKSICDCIIEQLTEEQADDENLEIDVIDARPGDVWMEPQDDGPDWDSYPITWNGVIFESKLPGVF